MRPVSTLLVLASLLWGPATADHAPEWLHSSRSSAPLVLKLKLGEASLRQAIARLGKPHSKQDLEKFPGESEYVWKLDGLTVTATTQYPPKQRSPDREIVYTIEIAGGAESDRVLTEHGLRMGSGLRELVQTYGWRYMTGWRRPVDREAAVITFIFKDESELSAALSDEGTLVRLFVAASVE